MKGSHAIGVDVGGTKILAGVVDREGNVVRRRERPTPTGSQDALLAGLEVLHREALPPGRESVQVVQAKLGTAAGLIGAAFVGFEAFDAAA